MNLKQKAVTGIAWSIIQKWGREGISLLTFVVLSRLLDPEAFGMIAMTLVVIVFIQVFQDQGFTAAIVQRENLEQEHLDTAFWSSILLGLLLTAGIFAISDWLAVLLNEPRLAPVLNWLSISFIFTALSNTQKAILQRELDFKGLATRSLAATLVGGIVGVSMAFAGYGVWSLVAQNLAQALTGVIVLWSSSEWRPGFKISKTHYKDLFIFGLPIIGNNLLKTLNRRLDHFLIGYFLGSTLLGYYTIGYRMLMVVIRLVTGVINSVAFPIFSRLQQDQDRIRSAFYKVTQYSSLIAIPVFTSMSILAPELIIALFGEKWIPSIPVMQILALIGIVQSMLSFNGSVMRACGKPSWQFGIMLLNSVSYIIAFLIAVQWGIVAVAAAVVIVGYLLAPFSHLIIRKLIGINFKTYISLLFAPFIATLSMVIVIIGLKYFLGYQELNVYLQLSIYIPAAILTYISIMGLTARSLSRQIIELIGVSFSSVKLKKR